MPEIDGWDLISQLYRNLSMGLVAIDKIPQYLKVVIDKNLWRRQIFPNGMVVEFDSFKDFIEAPPPKGFGIPIKKFKELCRLHPDVVAKIDRLIEEDSDGLREEKAIPSNQLLLRRRLERLLKDFPRDQVLTGMSNMGLITAPAPVDRDSKDMLRRSR
ncbi:MAG: hypothetical protein ACLP5H_23370 [Desulfomonilaceae bacterium]